MPLARWDQAPRRSSRLHTPSKSCHTTPSSHHPGGRSKVRVGQGARWGSQPGLCSDPCGPTQDCTRPPPRPPHTFSLHSSWLPWPSEHRKSCSRRSSQSTCRVRLARPPAGASLMSLRADSSIISRRLGKARGSGVCLLPASPPPALPAGLRTARGTPHLRLMQSGGHTSVAEAPSWVSTEKTWPRSRQAASSLSSTPRHVTRNSMLVSRLHSSSSGVCCGPRWVVQGVGRGQRGSGWPHAIPVSTPCPPLVGTPGRAFSQ